MSADGRVRPLTGCKALPGAAHGITLIETLITLAILVIVTAIAAPSFTSVMGSSKTKSAAQDLESHLELARSEAIRLSRTVSLCPSSNGSSCTAAGTNWRTGWLVFDDVNGNGALDAGDSTSVLKVQGALSSSLTLTGPTSVTFRSIGQAVAAGSYTISDSSGSANTRYVCLLLSGASSVKTSAC